MRDRHPPKARRRHRIAKALPRAEARDVDELWDAILDHHELIGRACVQRLGDVPEAEDARQDVVVRAATEGPKPDELPRLAALARQEVDRRRWWKEHHGAEPAGLLPSTDGLDPGDAALARIAIADAVRKLSKSEREAVAAAVQGYSLSEAAWRLGIGINAFKGRLRAAREHLRALGLGLGAGLAGLLRRLRARLRGAAPVGASALRAALNRLLGSEISIDVTAQTVAPAALALLLLVGASSPTPAAPSSASARRGLSDAAAVAPRLSPVSARAFTRHAALLPLELRRPPLGTLHPFNTSGGDTIEDTQLTTATAAPDYESTHSVVGVGTGASCGCPLLYRTADGGRTWEHTEPGVAPSVAVGATIALPPRYPSDPRIFIGNPARPGLFDYVAPAFGQRFTALPLPPGQLAVSAGLDDGDPRVFDATAAGILGFRPDTEQASVVVAQSNPGWPPLMATPYGDKANAVVVLAADGTAIAPAISLAPPTLLICPRSGPCAPRASVGILPGAPVALALSPGFASDGTLIVATLAEVAVSSDAGSSFQSLPAPPDGTTLHSAVVTPSGAWAIAEDTAGAAHVLLMTSNGSTWMDRTSGDPVLSRRGRLLAASGGRLIDIVLGVAVRCTVDDGVSWHARCPA